MKKENKKLYLALNQKMLAIQGEMDKLQDNPQKLAEKEKLYRKVLEEANNFWELDEKEQLLGL